MTSNYNSGKIAHGALNMMFLMDKWKRKSKQICFFLLFYILGYYSFFQTNLNI